MGVYFARLPVFDSVNSVIAYELPYSPDNGELPVIDLESIVGGVRAFVRLSDGLSDKLLKSEIPHEAIAVEVPFEAFWEDCLSKLRESGFTVILNDYKFSDGTVGALKAADIVRLDFRQSPITVEETAAACREYGKEILAANINTREELDYAKRLGCAYFQGFFFAKPAEEELQPLPVNIMDAMALMSQPDPEISDIVETLSRDAELCRKILRLINSVYFGVTNKVSSISQAILILGLDYLREWIYLMGVQKITRNENVETIRLSLLNAKLCRKLAERLPEVSDSAAAFYLMGLLSTGVFSGKKQFAKALSEFPLSDEIKQGLLRKGGVYSDVLEMTLAYGRADWERFKELSEEYDIGDFAGLYAECTREIEEQRLGV